MRSHSKRVKDGDVTSPAKPHVVKRMQSTTDDARLQPSIIGFLVGLCSL